MNVARLVRVLLVAVALVVFGSVLAGLARARGPGGVAPAPTQWRRVR